MALRSFPTLPVRSCGRTRFASVGRLEAAMLAQSATGVNDERRRQVDSPRKSVSAKIPASPFHLKPVPSRMIPRRSSARRSRRPAPHPPRLVIGISGRFRCYMQAAPASSCTAAQPVVIDSPDHVADSGTNQACETEPEAEGRSKRWPIMSKRRRPRGADPRRHRSRPPGMIVAPCSVKTLAEITTGVTATLISRPPT